MTADCQLDRPREGLQQVASASLQSNINPVARLLPQIGIHGDPAAKFEATLVSTPAWLLCQLSKISIKAFTPSSTSCKQHAQSWPGGRPRLMAMIQAWTQAQARLVPHNLPSAWEEDGCCVQPIRSTAALPTATSLQTTTHQHQQQLVASRPQCQQDKQEPCAMWLLSAWSLGICPPIKLSCDST